MLHIEASCFPYKASSLKRQFSQHGTLPRSVDFAHISSHRLFFLSVVVLCDTRVAYGFLSISLSFP
jgi:hypothetical protein